jgi:SSS family solute:Na+ symporter
MACNLGVMLLASARMMSELFGWGETTCILATAVLVGAYTIVGGLAAVVYTDMIQCTVMIAGCLGVLVLGLVELGGPTAFWEQLEPAQKALVLPVDTDTPFPWTGILFGLAMILSPAYWIGNQAIVQRSLGAKSAFQAQAAYVWGAVLKSLIPVIIVGPGLVAVLLYPELDQADHAFPQLVAGLLPAGLRGIFLAAFLAALMSSVDSYLNSASTLVAHDIYRRFVAPEADAVAMLRVGRSVTAILVIWSIACAMVMARLDEGIYTIFQTLMSFFQGPALAVLLAGTLWKRATGTGALVGFLGGLVTTVGQFLLNNDAVCGWLGLRPLFQIDEPFLYYSIWGFLVAGGLLVTVSLLTRREPDEKTSLTVLR